MKRTPEETARRIFTARLERLCRLRREYRDDLDALGVTLLNRAIVATYGDLWRCGARREALLIIADAGVDLTVPLT